MLTSIVNVMMSISAPALQHILAVFTTARCYRHLVVDKNNSAFTNPTQISTIRLHRTGPERIDKCVAVEALQRGVAAWRRHRRRAPLTDRLPRLYIYIKRKS